MQTAQIQPKGRNADLITYRNQKLAARFYFYSCIIGLKFSKCLENLTPEFDLSESRICDLLSENSDKVSQMERKSVTLQELKNYYPFLNWQLPSTKSQNSVQLSLDLFSKSGL